MSRTEDYKAAKRAFDDHVARHKCKAKALAEADGLPVCETRIALFNNMMTVAGRLGRD